MASDEELKDEEKRIRYLRTVVALTTNTLRQQRMSLVEAKALIESTKKQVLKLFPDKEEAFELIYRPRFERILKEKMEALGDGVWTDESEEEN
jgi:DNA-directed RNA polymerase subunit F